MANEKKEKAQDIESGDDPNEGLRKVGSIALPAIIGAMAVPFILSATALSVPVVGGIAGAVCGASYLAGQKK